MSTFNSLLSWPFSCNAWFIVTESSTCQSLLSSLCSDWELLRSDVVAHVFNPSSLETETGGSLPVPGLPGLDFQPSFHGNFHPQEIHAQLHFTICSDAKKDLQG